MTAFLFFISFFFVFVSFAVLFCAEWSEKENNPLCSFKQQTPEINPTLGLRTAQKKTNCIPYGCTCQPKAIELVMCVLFRQPNNQIWSLVCYEQKCSHRIHIHENQHVICFHLDWRKPFELSSNVHILRFNVSFYLLALLKPDAYIPNIQST